MAVIGEFAFPWLCGPRDPTIDEELLEEQNPQDSYAVAMVIAIIKLCLMNVGDDVKMMSHPYILVVKLLADFILAVVGKFANLPK